jgi:hypothetical protein
LPLPLSLKTLLLPAPGLVIDPMVLVMPPKLEARSFFRMEGKVTVFPSPALLPLPATLPFPLLLPAELLN